MQSFVNTGAMKNSDDFCNVQKPHSEAYYTYHIIQYEKIVGTDKEWVTLLTSAQVLST